MTSLLRQCALRASAVFSSPKRKKIVSSFEESPKARYAVVCDPIDGSSNLDAGVSVGTIFGVFKLPDNAEGKKEEVLLARLRARGERLHHVRCLGAIGDHDEGW